MTTQVNIQEAKTHLSRLLTRAAAGEDIVIARRGAPAVRLVPVTGAPPRQLGFLGGEVVPDDFWAPLPDGELDLWS